MIISASRRTDIPAYYSEWLMHRIRSGYCEIVNPFNPNQISRLSLKPADVDVIVFWTRNAAPMLPHLTELDEMGYRYYFLYTLIDYPECFEPRSGPLEKRLGVFKTLAGRIGPARVVWRYDPLILSNITPTDYHIRTFSEMARSLQGHTQRCILSLLDLYAKTKRRMRAVWSQGVKMLEPSRTEIAELMAALCGTAANNAMECFTCAEAQDFSSSGAPSGKCIDNELIEQLFALKVTARKDPHQRKACCCVISRDIGAYDTCPAGCIYCYATADHDRASRHCREHNPLSTSL